MKKNTVLSLAALSVVFLPVIAFAQDFSTDNLISVANQLKGVVNSALVVLAGVAVIVFIVGIIQFVLRAGDAEKRKEARGYMIYGVIAFAVIIGLYGLANAVLSFFGITATETTSIPQID